MFTTLLFAAGCGQAAREQQLVAREKQVREQQQELILKANQLALKEAELQQLAQNLDSTAHRQDSLKAKFPQLPGGWNVQMDCTQATCPGSAVGDTKAEQWIFSIVNGSVIAQAYAKKLLSRVYVGQYQNGVLQLTAQSTDTVLDGHAKITVFLRAATDSLSMTGKRSIIRPDCQIIYDLTMKKQ